MKTNKKGFDQDEAVGNLGNMKGTTLGGGKTRNVHRTIIYLTDRAILDGKFALVFVCVKLSEQETATGGLSMINGESRKPRQSPRTTKKAEASGKYSWPIRAKKWNKGKRIRRDPRPF